jgi:uncharacterized protein YjbI with pentapeptide repeats
MANEEHLARLKQGVVAWNQWRAANFDMQPDLREVDLEGANLPDSLLQGANLYMVDLHEADLTKANLYEADLHGANLQRALLVQTNFEGANLTGCFVYGISAWNVHLAGAQQSDLIITPSDDPVITVDNLEVAQFIYLEPI